MTTILWFAVGIVAGGSVAWVLATRRALSNPAVARITGTYPADEMLGSETATHIAAGLNAEYAFDPLAYTLIERCAGHTNMPSALVMRERLGGVPLIVAVAGGLDQRLLGREMHLDTPAGRAITSGLPVVSAPEEKVVELDRADRRRLPGGGIAVPVVQGGQVYGAVLAFGVPAIGTGEAMQWLAEEVKKFGPVLIPAYLAAAAARQAETDELTALPNRRALNSVLRRVNGERASLIVFDIDHFKQVNDTLGHAAGDQALRHVARVVRETIRGRDFPARIGGEEFAVWLPGADPKTARDIAERLRANLEGQPFRYDGQEHTVTISLGVASYPNPIRAVENLMQVADAALYRAKRAGRNRVVAHESDAA